jgi:hypothetical protein
VQQDGECCEQDPTSGVLIPVEERTAEAAARRAVRDLGLPPSSLSCEHLSLARACFERGSCAAVPQERSVREHVAQQTCYSLAYHTVREKLELRCHSPRPPRKARGKEIERSKYELERDARKASNEAWLRTLLGSM